MEYQCWLPAIKDVILAVAGVIGSVVAILGLSTWKRQLRGQSEYDLARRFLKSLYVYREAINSVRNSWMQYAAEPNLPQDKLESMSEDQKEWHARAQAWEKRWEPVAEARIDLDTNALESEVFWGTEIKDIMGALSLLEAELFVAIRDDLQRTDPRHPDMNYYQNDARTNREIIYARNDRSKDGFLDRMLTVIEDIETILKPHVRRTKSSKKTT